MRSAVRRARRWSAWPSGSRVVSLRRPEDVEPVGIHGRGDLPPIGPVCASGLDCRRGGRFTFTAVARVSSIWRGTVVIPHRCSSRGRAIYGVATSDVVVPKPGGRGMPARPTVDLQGPGGGSRGRRRPGAPQPARNARRGVKSPGRPRATVVYPSTITCRSDDHEADRIDDADPGRRVPGSRRPRRGPARRVRARRLDGGATPTRRCGRS